MKVVKYVVVAAIILGGLNALRLRQAEEEWNGFTTSCESGCPEALEANVCRAFCGCMKEEIEARYPSKSERFDHLRALANQHEQSGQVPPEAQEIALLCVERVQS